MPFQHGYALLIGVGTYLYIPRANIPVSVKDAHQVAETLLNPKLCGYPKDNVTLLHDQQATRENILQAFTTLADRAGPEDTVFLYYSGHGAYGADGNYYLTCADTRTYAEKVAKVTAISEGELLACLQLIKSRRLVFFCNACHAGEISPHLDLEDQDDALESLSLPHETADAILSTGQGRVIVTACREEQKSWIGNGSLSIFAQALVDGLKGKGARNNGGMISAFDLYEVLYKWVKKAAADLGHEQEPEITVLKGVGPFPLALYKGASDMGDFDNSESLPGKASVRQTSQEDSAWIFKKRVIHTGGGAYFEGPVKIQNGDLITGTKIEYHNHAPDPRQAAAQQREQARVAYLKALRTTCQSLPLAAIGGEEDGSGVDVTLDHVYIDLDTTTPVKRKEKDGRGEEEIPLGALEAAAGERHVVLLGDPGSGKSTFVRHLLARQAAAELGEGKPLPGFDAGLLPILVTLRDLAPRLKEGALAGDFEALSSDQRQQALLRALHDQIEAECRNLGKAAAAFAGDAMQELEDGPRLSKSRLTRNGKRGREKGTFPVE